MAIKQDWYPRDMESLVSFYANLNTNLPHFEVKYNIRQETLDRVKANYEWLSYWVAARYAFDQTGKQLTRYFNAIAYGRGADGAITAPILDAVNDAPPSEVPFDIEAFTRALRREIVARANYSTADGELLGFVAPDTDKRPEESLTASFVAETQPDFALRIKFKKEGADALRVEHRHKGENWMLLTILTADGTARIPPKIAGQAEQIELRAILLRKNQPFGNYSDIRTAIISP